MRLQESCRAGHLTNSVVHYKNPILHFTTLCKKRGFPPLRCWKCGELFVEKTENLPYKTCIFPKSSQVFHILHFTTVIFYHREWKIHFSVIWAKALQKTQNMPFFLHIFLPLFFYHSRVVKITNYLSLFIFRRWFLGIFCLFRTAVANSCNLAAYSVGILAEYPVKLGLFCSYRRIASRRVGGLWGGFALRCSSSAPSIVTLLVLRNKSSAREGGTHEALGSCAYQILSARQL